MYFAVDERIQSSSIKLIDWPLSRVFLKDESRFPWFLLVPRVEQVEDVNQLEEHQSYQLIREVRQLSGFIKKNYQPDKINIASLGNIVKQLHVHVVGRYTHDPYWPQGIWQADYSSNPHQAEKLKILKKHLTEQLTRLNGSVDL